MAPNITDKSKTKKENAALRKRVLASQEKVLKIKRNILAIVEAMLENKVSKDWFLQNVVKLCHADYDDVIEERSIEHLCGYPLCSNPIKQVIKQKYHISQVTNKVYDLTERKNFCGNLCFKASQYLKAQLSPIPLYMRKEEHIEVHLIPDSDNKGSAGEEVLFHHKISKEEIKKVVTVEKATCVFMNMLNDEIKNCSDSLAGLKITEHVFDKEYDFKDSPRQEAALDQGKVSNENSEIDSDDSVDENLFPAYDKLSVLSDKLMPIPKKTIKSQLISPKKPQTIVSSPVQMSLNFVFDAFKDWMTEDTMKYLLGEKYVYEVKADHLFEKMTTTDSVSPDKLSSMKNDYINLCLKIDSLPDDDFGGSAEIDFLDCSEKNHSCSEESPSNTSNKNSFKKRTKNNYENHRKKVTFAENSSDVTDSQVPDSDLNKKNEVKELSTSAKALNSSKSTPANESLENSRKVLEVGTKKKKQLSSNTQDEDKLNVYENTSKVPETAYEGGMPFIDSVSQNALRKNVLTSKFQSAYNELLPIIGLHYTDVRKSVKVFVGTLSLTPTNVMFRPKEWKLISLILLRILTRTVLKNILEEERFLKLCKDPIIPTKVNVEEIDKIVGDVLSPENILALPVVLH